MYIFYLSAGNTNRTADLLDVSLPDVINPEGKKLHVHVKFLVINPEGMKLHVYAKFFVINPEGMNLHVHVKFFL